MIYARFTQSPVDCAWLLPRIRVRIRIVVVSVVFGVCLVIILKQTVIAATGIVCLTLCTAV